MADENVIPVPPPGDKRRRSRLGLNEDYFAKDKYDNGEVPTWSTDRGKFVPELPTGDAAFTDHSARHENGGADEISIAGLDGTPVELTNHLTDTADAHDASTISNVPAGTVAATTVQAAIDELATDYAAADAAHVAAGDPHTGYRLESADHTHESTGLQAGKLTAAALTGTPGGELGGTWSSPTVDANHGGVHAITQGGTGSSTAQDAINALTQVSAATNEHVLTKDTTTGGAIWKAAAGGAVATDAIWDAAGDLAVGTGANTAAVLTIGAANSVLVSNGTTASWDTAPQLGSIQDTAGTTAITINTTSPFVEITSLKLTSTTAALMLQVSPAYSSGTTNWTGISCSPVLTVTGGSLTHQAITGIATATISSGVTLVQVAGLIFTVLPQNDSGFSATCTFAYGAFITAKTTGNGAATMTTGTLTGIASLIQIAVGGGGTAAITTAYTYWAKKPVGAGTNKNITNIYGMYIDDHGWTGATIATGLRVLDVTSTATTKKVFEFGTTTPTTTSAVFYMSGSFAAAANVTPLFVSEGATPTVRQLKTFDPGNLGVNFTAGQLVCVLV